MVEDSRGLEKSEIYQFLCVILKWFVPSQRFSHCSYNNDKIAKLPKHKGNDDLLVRNISISKTQA